MKKSKIILISVTILAIFGGALAFKANRFEPPTLWYIPAAHPTTLTTTLAGGFIYSTTIPNCTLDDNGCTTDIGPWVNTSTSTTRANVTTIFTRLVSPGVTVSFTTTYHFCTLYVTKRTICDL